MRPQLTIYMAPSRLHPGTRWYLDTTGTLLQVDTERTHGTPIIQTVLTGTTAAADVAAILRQQHPGYTFRVHHAVIDGHPQRCPCPVCTAAPRRSIR